MRRGQSDIRMNGKRNYLSFPVEMRTTGNWRSPEPFRSAAGRAGLTGYISILAMQTAGNRFYLQTKRMPQKTDTASVRWQCDRCTTMQVQRLTSAKSYKKSQVCTRNHAAETTINEKKKNPVCGGIVEGGFLCRTMKNRK